MNIEYNSREKMAHRTNSIQWRVTLPPAICLVLGIPITHIVPICFKEDSAKRLLWCLLYQFLYSEREYNALLRTVPDFVSRTVSYILPTSSIAVHRAYPPTLFPFCPPVNTMKAKTKTPPVIRPCMYDFIMNLLVCILRNLLPETVNFGYFKTTQICVRS